MHEMNKVTGYTYFDTFTFRGKEYPMNTSVKIKDRTYTDYFKPLFNYPLVQVVQNFIDKSGTRRWTYALWTYSGHMGNYITTKTPEEMIECILEVPKPAENTKPEYYKDTEVEGVIAGWLIYLLAMFFSMIFKDFIVAWVFITFMFFVWRKDKLKKSNDEAYGINIREKKKEWDREWEAKRRK